MTDDISTEFTLYTHSELTQTIMLEQEQFFTVLAKAANVEGAVWSDVRFFFLDANGEHPLTQVRDVWLDEHSIRNAVIEHITRLFGDRYCRFSSTRATCTIEWRGDCEEDFEGNEHGEYIAFVAFKTVCNDRSTIKA